MKPLALAAAVLALAAPAAAQEKHADLGLTLEPPRGYAPIPVQPEERLVVLRYVGERPSERKERKGESTVQPELAVIRLEMKPDPVPLPDPPPLTSLERYLAQRMETWKVLSSQPGKARTGWTCTEYELRESTDALAGWACELRGAKQVWILLGLTEHKAVDKESAAWRKCAESLEFSEPTSAPDAQRWTKFYTRNPAFRNPEARIALRAKLVGGWEAEDTANFLVVYHTRKESLVNHLEKRLEGIRRSYLELFPPAGEVTAVSTVRICEDQQEYHQYGGPEGTAGYWNPASEELVLFVFENRGANWQSGKEDCLIVLLHEAFHQYIHYAAGELAPHSWFNEGYGDYFSGTVFNQAGEVGRVQVNPWRIDTIQAAIWSREHPSWSKIVAMEQPEFYGPGRGVNYAMGWSMIYFLERCPQVKKKPAWKAILPKYYETLKAAHGRERTRLEGAGLAKNEAEVEKAAKTVREEAVKAAFEGVDMGEIQEAWRAFVLELKAPK